MGVTRPPFPFRTLLNRALMFISSFIKEPGAGGEWSARTISLPKSRGGWIWEQGCVHVEEGRKPEALEKALFNKALF